VARIARIAALPLLLWAAQAAAVETPLYEVPYIGGAVSGFNPDKARNADVAGTGYQVFGGWPIFNDHTSIEARLLDHQMRRKFGPSENNYSTSLYVDYVHDFGSIVKGTGFFGGAKLFVGAGLGVTQEDSYGEKATAPGVDATAGILVPLGFKGWAIRLDGRATYQLNSDTCSAENSTASQQFCTKEQGYLVDTFLSAGLQIPLTIFFDKPTVPESDENCPVAVVDPVTGRRDCGAKGSDGDGDGVPDTKDRCPSTAMAFSVDDQGCVTTQAVDLPATMFDAKSGALTAEGKKRVDEVAGMLAGERNAVVTLRSLSGGKGSAAFNEMLSQKRADAVRSHLASRGIGDAQMPADGNAQGKVELTLTITP
jgi:OmpA-OmpF porin, OOP family